MTLVGPLQLTYSVLARPLLFYTILFIMKAEDFSEQEEMLPLPQPVTLSKLEA